MIAIIFLITSITLLYFCLIRPFRYWSRRGVLQKSLLGQWIETLRLVLGVNSIADVICMQYNEFPNKRYVGLYRFFKPILFVRDPDLIKQITIKDFDHFVNRSEFISEEQEPLWGKNLLQLKSDRWRDMRTILTVWFTSSRTRQMFTLMNDSAQHFISYLKTIDTHNIEMKDLFGRFANDVIASTAFSISCDSFQNKNYEFYLMGIEITSPKGFWRSITYTVMLLSPKLARFMGLEMFTTRSKNFFRNIVKNSIELREKNKIVRPDLIHLLMEAKKSRMEEKCMPEITNGNRKHFVKFPLTYDDLTAQALNFFFAGLENASSVMSFLVYELVLNPEVQTKLRNEIDSTLANSGGNVTYENIVGMKYMDMVISETLRKWPPAPFVDRLCEKPYVIEPLDKTESPLYIRKNEVIILPIVAIHRDADYFPDPDKFDPERFSDSNKGNIPPFAYIPFGCGPRSCIGGRYVLIEIKTIIFYLLANFEIIATPQTPSKIKISKRQFILASSKGFWITLKPRSV